MPVPLPPDVPLSDEPDVSGRFVEVPGARLSVLELRLPNPKGAVFFLHGNSANLKEWSIDGSLYRRAILDLVMMGYRGYGNAEQVTAECGSKCESRRNREANRSIIGSKVLWRPGNGKFPRVLLTPDAPVPSEVVPTC